MSKNLLQDMIKIKHTRNGIRPDVARQFRNTTSKQSEAGEIKNKVKNSRYKLWLVAIVSIVVFIFALSYLFSRVVVTVNPKVEDVALNENISASKDGGTELLPFDLMVISGEENTTVQTTEKKDVLQKAQGIVILYNAFNSFPQTLNIETKLEGSNGKIYKTQAKTVVPGIAKDGKPGSVEVKVYGSVAGADYNSAPLDFKISGFKGTPKYSLFYGRSKGAITGGLKGKFPFISDSQKTSVISELSSTLQGKLFKKAKDQIPDGFILFKDAVFLYTDDNAIDLSSSYDNTLPVKLKGALYGLLFNVDKLTKKIAKDKVKKYDGSEVYIPHIEDLTFSLSNSENISFADVKNINFNLSGNVKIVWKLDTNKLISDLLGKSKKDFNKILLQYPNIDSANLKISPIWKISIPDKTKNIKVMVNYPE